MAAPHADGTHELAARLVKHKTSQLTDQKHTHTHGLKSIWRAPVSLPALYSPISPL